MTGHERNRITQMAFAVSDLERISDHAINIAEYALQLKQKKTALSDKAMGEIKTLSQSVTSAVDFCIDIFESDDFDKLDEAEKQEQAVDELEKKLKKSGNYSRQAEESVKALKNQVAQQAAEIETLQAALKDANVKIEDLTNQVSNLNTTVENVTSQRDAAEQEAVRIANELNTCYYVIGSNKELKANNIIQKKFLGKTKVMEGDYELSYFTKADKRSLTEIPLHSAKAKVMTKQPAGSYEIIDKDGVKTLRITNATKFWELSNFLVIQID